LDVIDRFVLFPPAGNAGVNVAVIVQLPPGVMVGVRLGHGLGPPVATLNIPASPPVMPIELITRFAVPVFEIVNACGVDELPIFTFPKL
jgi:hypothetical protein